MKLNTLLLLALSQTICALPRLSQSADWYDTEPYEIAQASSSTHNDLTGDGLSECGTGQLQNWAEQFHNCCQSRAIAECGPIADSAVGCHVVPPQVTSVPASIGEILMKIMNTLPLPGSAYKRRNYQYDPATREHVEIAQTPTSSNNRPQCWEQHDLKLWANAFYYCLCSKDEQLSKGVCGTLTDDIVGCHVVPPQLSEAGHTIEDILKAIGESASQVQP